MQKNGTIVWCDLETTGLDETEHDILEVGIVITDDDLETIATGNWLVKGDFFKCSDAVLDMHGESGLLHAHETTEEGIPSCADVEEMMRDFILRHCEEKEAILANNSVHFDDRFLREKMPSVIEALHYRRLDVSSVRRAHRLFSDIPFEKPKASHRSVADCHTAIKELKELYERYNAFVMDRK